MDPADEAVLGACMLLASKVEERGAPGAAAAALRAAVQGCGVLVGADYYAAKQELITAEQRLLRALQFEVVVSQPHAGLLNAARTLRLAPGLQRLALSLLNDLWTYTRLCLLPAACQPPGGQPAAGQEQGGWEAWEVSMAILEAAVRLSGAEVWLPSPARNAGLAWWQLLGVARDEAGMAGLVAEVLGAIAGCHHAARGGADGAADGGGRAELGVAAGVGAEPGRPEYGTGGRAEDMEP
ncbi:hypothetical protein GPECTOR_49g505 [Gonium pectorale]|uniref:Cyclin N-terminal domain-containing protein n=1 Tax=Gonium pectorale TaxID=33097 RepID=A0A150G7X5_GONPE|nr:hypothetical protein GPECTOR_49g505 [Gonium pectorale]|eukprot:KXZ45921.1 hypothetical protein GPECTOR_49g505 [Gonium pectorale]